MRIDALAEKVVELALVLNELLTFLVSASRLALCPADSEGFARTVATSLWLDAGEGTGNLVNRFGRQRPEFGGFVCFELGLLGDPCKGRLLA